MLGRSFGTGLRTDVAGAPMGIGPATLAVEFARQSNTSVSSEGDTRLSASLTTHF